MAARWTTRCLSRPPRRLGRGTRVIARAALATHATTRPSSSEDGRELSGGPGSAAHRGRATGSI